MNKVYDELIKKIDKSRIYLNEPMTKHTSLKIGGPADIFIKIGDLDELSNVIKIAVQQNMPLTVIGSGTNILVKERRN